MMVSAFEKFTLLDYPGKMVAVVFTPGCVFRCPFCHNPELIEPSDEVSKRLFLENREEEFFAFLEKRRGKLDGVCITGGEPTLQKDLLPFIARVKEMGFLVKLDSNGIFPHLVENILESGLVDYWAMDIKHTKEKYALATGKDVNIDSIKKSVELLMTRAKEYEFRTTVVPGIHAEEDFEAIGRWIAGAHAYYLQTFREGKMLDPTLIGRINETHIDMESLRKRMQKYVRTVEIRA